MMHIRKLKWHNHFDQDVPTGHTQAKSGRSTSNRWWGEYRSLNSDDECPGTWYKSNHPTVVWKSTMSTAQNDHWQSRWSIVSGELDCFHAHWSRQHHSCNHKSLAYGSKTQLLQQLHWSHTHLKGSHGSLLSSKARPFRWYIFSPLSAWPQSLTTVSLANTNSLFWKQVHSSEI